MFYTAQKNLSYTCKRENSFNSEKMQEINSFTQNIFYTLLDTSV